MRELISIITDEISMDLRECEVFLEENDLHAVELRCVGGQRVPVLSAEDRSRVRAWARNDEPRITAVSPGLFKSHYDDLDEMHRHLFEVLPATIELAVALDCQNVIAFTFEGYEGDDFLEQNTYALWKAAEMCEEADLWLLLENEPGFLASTGPRTMELIDAVGHGQICANWDPCNSNEYSVEQLGTALDTLTPRIANVHVKNGIREPGERFARCGPLREGEIDWTAHLRQLQKLRYDGYLCLETHFQPSREGSELILQELREMLAEIRYRFPWRP